MPRAGNNTSSSTTSSDQEILFSCKKCGDGSKFTATDRDAHKQWHKKEETKAKHQLRSSTNKNKDHISSGSSSELFEQIQPAAKTIRIPNESAPTHHSKSMKQQSTKTYDSDMIGKWSHGHSG